MNCVYDFNFKRSLKLLVRLNEKIQDSADQRHGDYDAVDRGKKNRSCGIGRSVKAWIVIMFATSWVCEGFTLLIRF